MRGRDSVIVTPRASFLCEMNCEPLAAYRCAITIVPLTRHAISDRVYYATYLSIGVLRQCRTTACAPSEEEEAGRRMFGRARFRVSVLLLVRFLSSRRITAAYQCQGGSSTRFSACVCVSLPSSRRNTNRVWKCDADDARDRCDRSAVLPISRGRLERKIEENFFETLYPYRYENFCFEKWMLL